MVFGIRVMFSMLFPATHSLPGDVRPFFTAPSDATGTHRQPHKPKGTTTINKTEEAAQQNKPLCRTSSSPTKQSALVRVEAVDEVEMEAVSASQYIGSLSLEVGGTFGF